MAKNILVGQSGGPTVAINASLAGVIREALWSNSFGEIYGALNGLEGILARNIIDLRTCFGQWETLEQLHVTPSMALGSCRYKLPEFPNEVFGKLRKIFTDYDIGYFFYIGGNDSMDTVAKLSDYFREVGEPIRCIGIPKTIDNDLPCTDHTPGFGSAAKYIATTIAEIAHDSAVYTMPSVTIVEIMGRNAGWLTAAAALARTESRSAPHIICLPEVPFNLDTFIEAVGEKMKSHEQVIAVASEGIRYEDGSYVSSSDAADAFGHVSLAGVGNVLKESVSKAFHCKVRSLELGILQRAAAHLASEVDINEAEAIGRQAVKAALQGHGGVMMAFRRLSDRPYKIGYDIVDIHKAANREKTVPLSWIHSAGLDVTQEMVDYIRPLIQGRLTYVEDGGIPDYCWPDNHLPVCI